MAMGRAGRLACVVAAAAALGACSTTSLTDPIQKFATASGNAEDALKAYDRALVSVLTERARAAALADRATLDFAKDECTTGLAPGAVKRCHVTVRVDGREVPLVPDAAIPQHLALAQQLSAYAANLAAIAAAGDKAGVEASVKAAGASLANIARTVKAPADIAIAGPAADAAAWLAGQYVDHLKFDALRKATAAGEPLVQKAQVFLADIAEQQRAAQAGRLSRRVTEARRSFERSGSPADLDALQAAAAELDTALRLPQDGIFAEFAAAHTALYRALNEGPRDLSAFIARVEELHARAAELVRIAMAIEKASRH